MSSVDDYDSLLTSWTRTLRGKADKTLVTYRAAALIFAEWAASEDGPDVEEPVDRPDTVASIAPRHIHGWLNDQRHRGFAASTINNRYRGLQQFLNWLVDEGEIDAHPMARMSPPAVPVKRVATVPPDTLKAILATCKKREFEGTRDAAILLMYVDTGARLSEVAGLLVENLDMKTDAAYSVGKGNKPRVHSFGNNTAMALERYLRHRAKHAKAHLPQLWLTIKDRGALTSQGIDQMVRRRCEIAKVPTIHVHQLRHTMATAFLDDGGNEGDLMRLMGWESRQMLKRYTDTTAERRAVANHKSRSFGDKL